jgi:hypothetical protein
VGAATPDKCAAADVILMHAITSRADSLYPSIWGAHSADAPPHAFMRYNTNRDLNVTSRGLGATPTVPHTTCGEENLLMEGDR